MSRFLQLVSFILVISFVSHHAISVAAQFSVPARYDGFALSGPKSTRPVVIETFLDLTCANCKKGWPVLKTVSEAYSDELIQIIVHPFPLPFHHNAYFAARGMHIAAQLNASAAYPWMEQIYAHQADFSTAATYKEAPEETVKRFAALAGRIGLDEEKFLEGYSDLKTDLLTVTSFKYGCHRAVIATPTFLVNGVVVQGADDSWTLSQWRKLLDPLLLDASTLRASV
eukprot:jgi/Mesen1/4726/ME000241S03762